jgi:hypothetical protein
MKIYWKGTLIPTLLNDLDYSTIFFIQPKLESRQNVLLWCKMFHKKFDFIIVVCIWLPFNCIIVSVVVSFIWMLSASNCPQPFQSRPFPDEAECPDWWCQTNFIWPNWCHQAELLSLVLIHEKLKTHNLWTKDSKFEIEDWRLELQAGLISAVPELQSKKIEEIVHMWPCLLWLSDSCSGSVFFCGEFLHPCNFF